jgi:hypothetical protein
LSIARTVRVAGLLNPEAACSVLITYVSMRLTMTRRAVTSIEKISEVNRITATPMMIITIISSLKIQY